MRILKWTLALLTVCGCLRPSSWTSSLKKFLYNFYTVCAFLIVLSLIISVLLDLILIVDNPKDFCNNIYLTLEIIVCYFKMCTMLTRQRNIEILIDTLQKEPFLPLNAEEVETRTKFDKAAESNAKTYTFVIEFCSVWIFMTPLILDFSSRNLSIPAWLPFDYTSPLKFCFAYVHQALCAIICTLSNIACDSLFNSLMIHIYCQYEILGCRLRNIQGSDNISVKLCNRHHNQIYKLVPQLHRIRNTRSKVDTISNCKYTRFAKMVNEEFKLIIFIQFLTSILVVCLNLYFLTLQESGSKMIEAMFYTVCLCIQLYYYCWYGNEVKLKSLEVPDIIFASDWPFLSNDSKKILLMIMRRATIPVEFTSLHVVSMNIDSFKTLIKNSYSAFNLLQRSQRL